jgi:hypothetical protein
MGAHASARRQVEGTPDAYDVVEGAAARESDAHSRRRASASQRVGARAVERFPALTRITGRRYCRADADGQRIPPSEGGASYRQGRGEERQQEAPGVPTESPVAGGFSCRAVMGLPAFPRAAPRLRARRRSALASLRCGLSRTTVARGDGFGVDRASSGRVHSPHNRTLVGPRMRDFGARLASWPPVASWPRGSPTAPVTAERGEPEGVSRRPQRHDV